MLHSNKTYSSWFHSHTVMEFITIVNRSKLFYNHVQQHIGKYSKSKVFYKTNIFNFNTLYYQLLYQLLKKYSIFKLLINWQVKLAIVVVINRI